MREAIVTLSDSELEAMGFGGLVSTLREAGIRDVELLEDRGSDCVPQVQVEERIDLDEIEEFECVDAADLVAEKDDSYVYIFELTATELPEGTPDDHEALIGNCDTALTERGVLVSLVGSHEAIRDMLRNYEAAGATPSLRKLAEYDGGSSTLDALTDRQLAVVRTAFELGFYEVPREASTEDVAVALDLDPATVSEHLQRAERNLLTQELPT
jgi:predicted DNA binding protein